jgi:preprotein translocase subunit SecG
MINTPLEQFTVETYIKIKNKYVDISINKTTIYLFITFLIMMVIMNNIREAKEIRNNKINKIMNKIYKF